MPGVTDVRGKGLMLAVEFGSSDRRDAVQEQAFTQGVLVLGAGERTIRLLPPLDLTDREVRLSAELVAEAARAV
jgi:4-aminobutyrate aminotransferase